MQGFVKDYRKELNSDIWMMPPMYHRVWQYLKYMVNHKPNKIPVDDTFLTINPGQHLTSVRGIAKGVGYYEQMKWREPNPKTVSKILEWMERQGMISIERGKGNRQYTLITLSNWGSYQSKSFDGNSEGTAKEHPLDINKNDKNEKEVFSSGGDGDFQEIMSFYQSNLQKGISETPHNHELIIQWFDEWGEDLLLAAMKVAAKQEAKGVSFVEGVLKNWSNQGVKTIEDARQYEKEFRGGKKNNVRYLKPRKAASDIDWDSL